MFAPAPLDCVSRERKVEFSTPNQLRGTLAEEALDADEEDRRREIVREWEHLQRRIRIIGFVIREWDFLAPKTDSVEVSR